jgi:hypothetical protein
MLKNPQKFLLSYQHSTSEAASTESLAPLGISKPFCHENGEQGNQFTGS